MTPEISDADMLELSVERYLDGSMSLPERAEFESRLSRDAYLRELVDLQRDIDSSLRRTHELSAIRVPSIPGDLLAALADPEGGLGSDLADKPAHRSTPDAPMTGERPPTAASTDILARIPIHSSHSPEHSARRDSGSARTAEPSGSLRGTSHPSGGYRFPVRRWAAMAAAAVVLVASAVMFRAYWDRLVPDFKLVEPVAMYDKLVRTGFTPAVVCTTESEFARVMTERLGSPLIAVAAPGIELLGWGYEDDYDGTPISPKTAMLLTRVDGREVLVLLDRVSSDRELTEPPADTGVNMFRREVNGFVAYEITPLSHPRVLPTLRKP